MLTAIEEHRMQSQPDALSRANAIQCAECEASEDLAGAAGWYVDNR
jgi:hypothetical protein